MKNKTLTIFLTIELFLCSFMIIQSFRYWLEPVKWGWPEEIRVRSVILIVFVITMLTLSLLLIKSSRIMLGMRRILGLGIIASTVGFGLFIMIYLPKPPNLDKILRQEDYHLQAMSQTDNCANVNQFIDVGSHRLDLGNRTVLVPNWLHSTLESVPQDMLVDCFANLMLEQENIITNNEKYNEEPIRKLHALVFEARRLNILDNPKLSAPLESVACNQAIDLFGKLAIEMYIVKNGTLPPYDYYSTDGKVKLYEDICR